MASVSAMRSVLRGGMENASPSLQSLMLFRDVQNHRMQLANTCQL